MSELVDKLQRNALFYRNEATALAEAPDRRDRRRLGAKEAEQIANLLNEAATALADEPAKGDAA